MCNKRELGGTCLQLGCQLPFGPQLPLSFIMLGSFLVGPGSCLLQLGLCAQKLRLELLSLPHSLQARRNIQPSTTARVQISQMTSHACSPGLLPQSLVHP
jgi:hypothetical protein